MSGRGRGRGRGRNQDAPQGPHGAQGHGPPTRGRGAAPHGMRGAAAGSSHQAPAASAWGARQQNSAPSVPNLAQRRLEQQMQQLNLSSSTSRSGEGGAAGPSYVAGDGAGQRHDVVGERAGPSRSGPEGAAGPVGRGSMRGRRMIETQIIRTKPDCIATKQGNKGVPINLLANYFKIKTLPDWALQQYRVDIAPEEDRTYERRNLVKVHREQFGWFIFDGTVLYTSRRLTVSPGESITLTSQSETGTIYTITVRHVNEVQSGDYAYQQVFNLLLRSCIRALGLQLVGREFYDPDPRVKIRIPEHGLELWPGYKTSIRQHEAGILMCVEITHKIMRTNTVLDLLQNCYHNCRERYQADFRNIVAGYVVLTKYNNKTYRITDVDFDRNPESTFRYQDKEISFAQYMKIKYQIDIRDLRQPLLISRARARDVRAGMTEIINLIPEVCFLTGLDVNMRSDWKLMKAVTQHTRVNPAERINRLLAFNQRLQSNEQAMLELRRFNMTLDNQLVSVPGKILKSEAIYLGRELCIGNRENADDWTRELKQKSLILPKSLTDWFVIYSIGGPRDKDIKANISQFIELMQRAGKGMGVDVAPPQMVEVRDNLAAYVQGLSQIMDSTQPNLIMIILPNLNGSKYSAIKKKCLVDRSVPSQVLLKKNLNDPKRSMSIASKIVIQITCKLGGVPWVVNIPPKATMVVGFDVCHDTNDKSRSYGALVASQDQAFSRYFSTVSSHSNGEELSHNFALNIINALREYQRNNDGQLPAKIIIYRDGVGEGQLNYVIETELKITKEKLAAKYTKHNFSLTFIIVTKRINTRLFMDYKNPAPGTIADDVITDPEKYDFFLVSQSVRDGTVSPTSYNIIHDESKFDPGQLQMLTYKLCHLYYNWSGTVKVPAPCQYAHKLAFLVGNFLHQEPKAHMNDKLYFL